MKKINPITEVSARASAPVTVATGAKGCGKLRAAGNAAMQKRNVPRKTPRVHWVTRSLDEDALDRMAERVAARPDILDRRREIVEHPFGSIKQWMNQGAFLMRGLEK